MVYKAIKFLPYIQKIGIYGGKEMIEESESGRVNLIQNDFKLNKF